MKFIYKKSKKFNNSFKKSKIIKNLDTFELGDPLYAYYKKCKKINTKNMKIVYDNEENIFNDCGNMLKRYGKDLLCKSFKNTCGNICSNKKNYI